MNWYQVFFISAAVGAITGSVGFKLKLPTIFTVILGFLLGGATISILELLTSH